MSRLKIECARRQLGTALDLYLRDLDPISVHCLASGGWEVIAVYAEKAGAQPLGSQILKEQPHLKMEDLRKIQVDYWNAFKHAEEVKRSHHLRCRTRHGRHKKRGMHDGVRCII
jgi:hypothetical protein